MLPINPAKLPDWTSENAALLRVFLESDTGKAAIAHVIEACPSLLDGSDVNKTLVTNGEVKGFSLSLSALFSLTHEQPQTQDSSEMYPDPEDDSKWPDRPKT